MTDLYRHTIYLRDPDLFRRVGEAADRAGMKRTDFIERALRVSLRKEDKRTHTKTTVICDFIEERLEPGALISVKGLWGLARDRAEISKRKFDEVLRELELRGWDEVDEGQWRRGP